MINCEAEVPFRLHFVWTIQRLVHAVPFVQKIEELVMRQRRVRRPAQSHDLPQKDAERPSGFEKGISLIVLDSMIVGIRVFRTPSIRELSRQWYRHSHVAHRGINPIEQSFRRHPFEWQHSVCRFSVVPVVVEVPRETKVSDFTDVTTHEHVPSGQVSMDAVFRSQVFHSPRDLEGERGELLERQCFFGRLIRPTQWLQISG